MNVIQEKIKNEGQKFCLVTSFEIHLFFVAILILTIAIPIANVLAFTVVNFTYKRVYYIPYGQNRDKKYPVHIGQTLDEGDLIFLEPNSQVTIQCKRKEPGIEVRSNRNSKTEPITKICGKSNPYLGDPTEIRRGGNEPLIPYIVSPRYTWLLTKKPTLKWNAVEGATRYTITLYREGLREDIKVWQKSVESQEPVEGVEEFSYPSGEKQLEAGADYRLVVEANNGRSSEEENIDPDDYDVESRDVSGLKFRLLGEADVQSIQKDFEEIMQKEGLSEEDKKIELAFHYTANNLYAEAIEILNSLVNNSSRKSYVYRNLGDFYAQSGLNLLAKKSYLKAIEKAQETQDVLEQALALQDLGELYMKMHEPSDDISLLEQARAQFEEALAKYQKLNRQPDINEITNLINQLQNLEANQ